MGKRKRKSASRANSGNLVAQAAHHLTARRFREAIRAYKELLKQEDRPEWRAALVQAYLGRAESLAAKGMYKEAVALWENMRAYGQPEQGIERYLHWLIQARQWPQAAQCYTAHAGALDDSSLRGQVQALFAAALLGGAEVLGEVLPADDPVVRHAGPARQALEAYCQGDDALAEAHLAKIPFRSPYRDFRQILKALLRWEAEPPAAAELLARVSEASPFAGLAQLALAVVGDEARLHEALPALDAEAVSSLAELKGWSPEQVELLRVLPRMGDMERNKAIIYALPLFKAILGPQRARHAGIAVLPHYPQGKKGFEKTFGALSTFERYHLQALAASRQKDLVAELLDWQRCEHWLLDHPEEPDNRLRAAMIQRHIAQRLERAGYEGFEDRSVNERLSQSLQLDPEDKPTYLWLIERHKQRREKKAYYDWVNRAHERFPDDKAVLLTAADAAMERKVFKKAAGYAKRLLEIDPINSHARRLLVNCHLAHARKQIARARHDLANKELELAESWERDEVQQGGILILRGLMENLASRSDQAHAALRQGLERLGGGLLARHRLLREAGELSIDFRSAESLAGKALPDPQAVKRLLGKEFTDPAEVVQLLQLLARQYEEDSAGALAIADHFASALKKALKLRYTEEEMLTLCGCLLQLEELALLRSFAHKAHKLWEERPEFTFYEIYAKHNGLAFRVPAYELELLQELAREARRRGDLRCAIQIEKFIMGPGGLLPPPALPKEDEFEDFIEEIAEEMGGMDRLRDVLAALLDGEHDFEPPTAPKRKTSKSGRKR